jgi:hypothetical protein
MLAGIRMKNIVKICFGCLSLLSFKSFAVEQIALIDSKYGKLVVRQIGNYSYLNAYDMGNIYVGVDQIKSVLWADVKDSKLASFMVLTTHRNSQNCPVAYIIFDARGDIPLISAPLTNCAGGTDPKVTMQGKDQLLIELPENKKINAIEESWIYKNGVLSQIK